GQSKGHKQEKSKENGQSNGHKNHVNDVNGDVGKVNEKTNGGNGEKANDEESDKEKPSMFNRLIEYQLMNEISKHGLCQPVYAKYSNGICYGYAEGTTLTGSLMNSEEYLQEAASKLARFHSIKYQI